MAWLSGQWVHGHFALPEVAPKATYMTLETGSNGHLSVCS